MFSFLNFDKNFFTEGTSKAIIFIQQNVENILKFPLIVSEISDSEKIEWRMRSNLESWRVEQVKWCEELTWKHFLGILQLIVISFDLVSASKRKHHNNFTLTPPHLIIIMRLIQMSSKFLRWMFLKYNTHSLCP